MVKNSLVASSEKMRTLKRQEARTLLRFASVGCMNTLVDFAVFAILRGIFDVYYLWCQVAGYGMGIVNSFIFNKIWTFENRGTAFSTPQQFIRFVLVSLFSLSISLVGLKICTGYWHINVYYSKVLVTALALAINYLGYKFWVFSYY